jgi:hypothetical protein
MFKKNFFLSAFILLALFKTAYIGLYTHYFDLESTNIAIITRIAIIIYGIILFFFQGKKAIHKNYFYIMLLFLMTFIVIVFQLQLDPEINLTKDKFYFLGFASSIIAVLSVLFACYKNLDNLSKIIFYTLIIFSVFALSIASDALSIASDEAYNRLQLKSLNPITIGNLAGMLVLISLWRMLYTKDKKLILFTGFIIGLWLLSVANSRGPVLGVIFSMLFFLLNKNKKYYLFVILSSLFIFFIILLDLDFINPRLLTVQDAGDSIRIEIYKSYIEMISRNIIFPLMDPIYNLLWAHNIFFSIYSGTGIFGLIIFLYLIYFTLRASFKLIYDKTPYGWVSLLFILTLTISLVSGAILDEFLWIMLALVNVYHLKQKKNI